MNQTACRWGILGCADIAQKNWKSIWNAKNATLVAVASRSVERAEAFIETCQAYAGYSPAPIALGSYKELLAREDIDAVYIPLPTGLRKEWIIKAAEAGKHVLAEKPCGRNADELKDIVEACETNQVQFMDGVMFMHSQRLAKLREVLDDGESVGELRRIATQFSFNAPEEFFTSNIRLNSDLEPLGALGDLGWYTIRLILWAVNYEMPERVSARLLTEGKRDDSPAAVPLEFSGELFFKGGISSTFYCSFITENQQWANFSGNKGYVQLNDFVLPFYGPESSFEVNNTAFDVDGCNFHMKQYPTRHTVKEYSDGMPGSQESRMIETFSALALSGEPDPHWPEIALKTQQVMDACLAAAASDQA